MAIYLPDLSLPYRAPAEEAFEKARRQLRLPDATPCRVVKKSLDARRRHDIRFVYTVALEAPAGEREIRSWGNPKIKVTEPVPLEIPEQQFRKDKQVIVAGFGPAGMFAGLVLARAGLRPVILEKGDPVEERVRAVRRFWEAGDLDPESNVQFGEGGAGTFSDGKLTTRIGDEYCRFILEELHRFGAPEEVLFQARPHVGTDKLREIVPRIRREIKALGGQVLFRRELTGVEQDGALRAVTAAGERRQAAALVLAPGNSARALFPLLAQAGVPVVSKPFSVGARIEHRQADIDRALYGDLAGDPLLPRGEYQLSHRREGRAVYTFCMCPGGVVVPAASESGGVVTNGMSDFARDGENANAALVVSVDQGDFGPEALDGILFQRNLERAAFLAGTGYRAPAQTVDRFLAGKPGLSPGKVAPTYARGVAEGNLDDLLPAVVTDMMREGIRRFDGKLRGFAAGDALLTGPETRTSCPVRIPRGEDMQSPVRGIYPCGEGAGYAGGIVSAAVDGVRAALAVIADYGA